MSSFDSEYDDSSDEMEISEKQINQVKQFKKAVFNPFWRNPHLHKKSSVVDHFEHALHTLNGNASDHIKFPFNLSPTWGLIFQHLKIQGDFNYTLAEFLKVITYKKFIIDTTTNTKKPNLDRNYCTLKEAIKKEEDISLIENHVGLLDFPYLINILTLLSIQASQKLHEISEQKKQDSKIPYNNTSPFLEFINNIIRRAKKLPVGTPSDLNDRVKKTYRALEITFYFCIRLWLEILAFLITPLWDLAKLIIAPTILLITFPIWYPISCHLYKDKSAPLEPDNPLPIEVEFDSEASENQLNCSA